MLTSKPTRKTVEEWKRIYNENRDSLKPNRKSGAEVNCYFRQKYGFEKYDSPIFCNIVKLNILENEHEREKLPKGREPQIETYTDGDSTVLVGIDPVTGFFHIEGEDIEKVAEIYDDLFAFRGLDEEDLKNCFLVAQYVQCHNKKGN